MDEKMTKAELMRMAQQVREIGDYVNRTRTFHRHLGLSDDLWRMAGRLEEEALRQTA